ncbi:hypothetical protein AnigIFM59636_000994 [Aspergillus niger]|nr:hypothetical protein AnigIFM59636_000994 [Aspergillus niger]
MSVNTSRNRNILEGLFKELLDMRDRVPEDGHISIARFRDIEHVTQFNFNELDSAEVNLALVPPVLFEPMDWASLKQHPVDPELAREFFDIDQDDECDFPMEPVDRVRQVSTLIEDRTTHEARSKQNLQTVQAPESTFLLEASLYRNYSYNSSWTARCLVEPCPDDVKVYPNLAFHVLGDKVSNEDSILYSELSAIVEAMKGRANQRRVDSERGREELDECDGRGKEAYPYLFSDEEYFPILVVSCVAPQHARVFTACMCQHKLLIRQSKLHSFERKSYAPVDFFARLLLSKPLVPRG